MKHHDLNWQVLTDEHIEGALKLCRLSGWNQTAFDWQRLIRLEPRGCFAAVAADEVVGTATTTSYGSNLAWIGMMLVHPDYRRKGLATQFIHKCLTYLQDGGIKCVKLDATPAGQLVYEKLGFEVELSFNRWVLDRTQHSPEPMTQYRADTVTCVQLGGRSSGPSETDSAEGDRTHFLSELLQLDELAFGADRSALLRDLAVGTRGSFMSTAYGLLRPGYLADYMGPIVAASPDEARQIVMSLVAACERNVFWDIPSQNDAAVELALTLGFERARDLTRMQTSRQQPAPRYEQQYAMFDPSVG